tara:strand:+ start:999 stop:1157 length:159 start_codon:yes stop_codon:yes gene_type:complete
MLIKVIIDTVLEEEVDVVVSDYSQEMGYAFKNKEKADAFAADLAELFKKHEI